MFCITVTCEKRTYTYEAAVALRTGEFFRVIARSFIAWRNWNEFLNGEPDCEELL